jgi:hypothetical protein
VRRHCLHNELILTLAETRRLIAAARPVAALVPTSLVLAIVEDTDDAVTDHAVDALRVMVSILSGFSIEWQFKLIKVLTARTS